MRIPMPSFILPLAALALSFACGRVVAQTAIADMSNAPGNGTYSFASSSPRTLMDVTNRSRPRPAATGQLQLLLPPPGAAAKVPAVVLVHGSGGVYPELAGFWARRFNEQGIAVAILDIFGPRGVRGTVEDQSQVPFSADLADAFGALNLLATHPRIDRERIAVLGFSRGGAAAWRAAAGKIAAGLANDGLRFAAHVAVYSGGCAGLLSLVPNAGVFGPAPILFVHGDADDYAYASDCRDYAQRIGAAGTPTEFVAIPGARHKFDTDDTRAYPLPNAQKTREGCPVSFDLDAVTYRDRRNGAAIPQAEFAAFYRDACQTTGASVQGDRKARDAAAQAIDAFLKRTLKP